LGDPLTPVVFIQMWNWRMYVSSVIFPVHANMCMCHRRSSGDMLRSTM